MDQILKKFQGNKPRRWDEPYDIEKSLEETREKRLREREVWNAESNFKRADPELDALWKKNQEDSAQLERLKAIQSFLKISAEVKHVTDEIEQLMYEVIDSAPQSMIDRIISYLDSSR